MAAVLVLIAAMHMAVLDFFCAGRANRRDRAGKNQGHASQRVIAIENNLVVGNFSNAIDNEVIFAAFFRTTLELHAHL